MYTENAVNYSKHVTSVTVEQCNKIVDRLTVCLPTCSILCWALLHTSCWRSQQQVYPVNTSSAWWLVLLWASCMLGHRWRTLQRYCFWTRTLPSFGNVVYNIFWAITLLVTWSLSFYEGKNLWLLQLLSDCTHNRTGKIFYVTAKEKKDFHLW